MDRPMSGLCTGIAPPLECMAHKIVPGALTQLLWPSSSLGGIHGIPRVHYKGRQGDYYVMVGIYTTLFLASTTNKNLDCGDRSWTCWGQACGTFGIPRGR